MRTIVFGKPAVLSLPLNCAAIMAESVNAAMVLAEKKLWATNKDETMRVRAESVASDSVVIRIISGPAYNVALNAVETLSL